MRKDEPELDRQMRAFAETCRAKGLKATHQRMEIYRQLAATQQHPDAETVYRNVRRRVPAISRDTVYRTLATLADLGLVARLGAGEGVLRYDANPARHHHFICRQCGRIRDVVDAGLDAVASGGARDLGTVETVHVQFRGVCRDCIERGVLP